MKLEDVTEYSTLTFTEASLIDKGPMGTIHGLATPNLTLKLVKFCGRHTRPFPMWHIVMNTSNATLERVGGLILKTLPHSEWKVLLAWNWRNLSCGPCFLQKKKKKKKKKNRKEKRERNRIIMNAGCSHNQFLLVRELPFQFNSFRNEMKFCAAASFRFLIFSLIQSCFSLSLSLSNRFNSFLLAGSSYYVFVFGWLVVFVTCKVLHKVTWNSRDCSCCFFSGLFIQRPWSPCRLSSPPGSLLFNRNSHVSELL